MPKFILIIGTELLEYARKFANEEFGFKVKSIAYSMQI